MVPPEGWQGRGQLGLVSHFFTDMTMQLNWDPGLLIAFLPGVVAFVWNVPAVVVGTILLYIMSTQLAAGLMVAFGTGGFSFQDGLIISIPLMVSIVFSYLPGTVKAAFSPLLMPIVGNGFVMGVLTVLIMEHLLYRTNLSARTN
jgi:xanthine/uracil permease